MLALIEYLLTSLPRELGTATMYATPKVDKLATGTIQAPTKSIAIRTIPSTPLEEYYSGSLIGSSFQVLTSSPNQKEAYTSISAITEHLRVLTRRLQPNVNNNVILQRLAVSTEPAFVEQNEANEYIYSAIFRAELLIN